jgi:hypothetical protein
MQTFGGNHALFVGNHAMVQLSGNRSLFCWKNAFVKGNLHTVEVLQFFFPKIVVNG